MPMTRNFEEHASRWPSKETTNLLLVGAIIISAANETQAFDVAYRWHRVSHDPGLYAWVVGLLFFGTQLPWIFGVLGLYNAGRARVPWRFDQNVLPVVRRFVLSGWILAAAATDAILTAAHLAPR